MKIIKIETSIAKAIYSRGDNQHSSVPGCFSVYNKITEENYWEKDCYDGGEGWANLDEKVVNKELKEKFFEFHNKYEKLLTDQDYKIIKHFT